MLQHAHPLSFRRPMNLDTMVRIAVNVRLPNDSVSRCGSSVSFETQTEGATPFFTPLRFIRGLRPDYPLAFCVILKIKLLQSAA